MARTSSRFITVLLALIGIQAMVATSAHAQSTLAGARAEMAAATVTCPSGGCPQGVAWLLTYREAGDEVAGSGTGITSCSSFIIAPRLLMTAKHCLPARVFTDGAALNGKMVAVFPRYAGSDNIQRIDVASVSAVSAATFQTFSHHDQDYAILELASDAPGTPLALSAAALPAAGDRISAHVFNDESTATMLRARYRRLRGGTLLERNVFQPVTITEAPATFLASGLAVAGGHSGGAVVNAAGQVIALVSFIYPGAAIRVLSGYGEAFERTPFTHAGLTSIYCATQGDSACSVNLADEAVFNSYLTALLSDLATSTDVDFSITARLDVR